MSKQEEGRSFGEIVEAVSNSKLSRVETRQLVFTPELWKKALSAVRKQEAADRRLHVSRGDKPRLSEKARDIICGPVRVRGDKTGLSPQSPTYEV